MCSYALCSLRGLTGSRKRICLTVWCRGVQPDQEPLKISCHYKEPHHTPGLRKHTPSHNIYQYCSSICTLQLIIVFFKIMNGLRSRTLKGWPPLLWRFVPSTHKILLFKVHLIHKEKGFYTLICTSSTCRRDAEHSEQTKRSKQWPHSKQDRVITQSIWDSEKYELVSKICIELVK